MSMEISLESLSQRILVGRLGVVVISSSSSSGSGNSSGSGIREGREARPAEHPAPAPVEGAVSQSVMLSVSGLLRLCV